jgi:hypothetical protein
MLFVLADMYICVQMCTKSAIILEWIHIFVPMRTRNAFSWTGHILIAVTVAFYVAFLVTTQFYCSPREKIWHTWLPGTCLNRRLIDSSSALFNAVLDFVIFILPQRVIWSLNISTSKKLGVSLIFSIGLLYVA